MRTGLAVRHSDYGPGRVREVLGEVAVVDFFGEEIEVAVADLEFEEVENAPVAERSLPRERLLLRRAYEAINLGVVPPSPDQLLALSIGGEQISTEIRGWLSDAQKHGLCKVVFGDYGTGKSHHLRLVEAVALSSGWAVAFVEFDPKQADPAKPHLVYRAITSALRFPARSDGQQARGFTDLVREIRNAWGPASAGRYFRESPWFRPTLEALRYFPHGTDRDYLDVIDWLAGQPVTFAAVRSLLRNSGGRVEFPPTMPRTRETGDIYVYHLVVIHELCRALGYRGLLLILDEAEHVRGYNVRRRERANNFFDLLARAAHPPIPGDPPPIGNEHGYQLPRYWREGPHFGVVVGLTEGNIFADQTLPIRDACVFLHRESDRIRLKPPRPVQYEHWCSEFLLEFHRHYPECTEMIGSPEARTRVAKLLATEFRDQADGERTLRLWIKLASLVPSVLLARSVQTLDQLEAVVKRAAREASGQILPWDL
jgi:hypothetical protein